MLQLRGFNANGRLQCTEWFDTDDEAQALARFDELIETPPKGDNHIDVFREPSHAPG